MGWRIVVDGSFDLGATMRSGQVFRWDAVPSAGGSVCWRGVVEGALLQLRAPAVTPRSTSARVEVELIAGEYTRTSAGRLLRCDDPYRTWCRDLMVDRLTRDAVSAAPGMRLLRQAPWDATVAFICSSANNQLRMRRMLDALANRLGEPLLDGDGRVCGSALPSAQRLAKSTEGDLRRLGLGYRARTLHQSACRLADEGLSHFLGPCSDLPLAEARERLCELPGVGPKVADCIALFSLDQLEAFPLDVWMVRVLEHGYPLRGPRTYRRLQRWVQRHLPSPRGYLQQFLYHHGRLLGRAGLAALRQHPPPRAGAWPP